jgi:nitrate reductase NapE component
MLLIFWQMLGSTNEGELSSTIAFLTAMITPALLISASGTLVLTTSTRLGRVIDRARELEGRLAELIMTEDKAAIPLYTRRIEVVFELLDKVTTRSRILQRSLFVFYCSLAFFVLTSLSIGFVGLVGLYVWMPIPIGLVGILFVFYGSILMMRESRMATATTDAEMDITWEIATKIAPPEIVEKYSYNEHGRRRLRSRIHLTSGTENEKKN